MSVLAQDNTPRNFLTTLLRCSCCSYVDVLFLLSCYYVLIILLCYILVLMYCYYHILITFLLLLCYCLHEIYKEVIITWTTWLVGSSLIQPIMTGQGLFLKIVTG
jgi:hypothetical protein